MGGFAWVTLATNDSYSLGALILAHSLKNVGTTQQLAVLVTPGVTDAMKEKLATVFDIVQEVNILDSKDEANLRLLKRPELGVTFTKLHCWRLTQFDKCVFLDADTLVLQNCDELFEREELSAAPDVGWPDCFNSGVFVYRPSIDTYEKLVQFALEKGSFDGGDQGLLNLYFSDWAHKDISKHLPFIYNMCSTACYSYLPAFKQFGRDAKIIHFIGPAKPWLQYFDSESRLVSPSGGLHHLQHVLQRWWDIFCEKIHPTLSRAMAPRNTVHSSSTLLHSSYIPKNPEIHDFSSPDDYQNVWDPWEEYDNRQTGNISIDFKNQQIVMEHISQMILDSNHQTNKTLDNNANDYVDRNQQCDNFMCLSVDNSSKSFFSTQPLYDQNHESIHQKSFHEKILSEPPQVHDSYSHQNFHESTAESHNTNATSISTEHQHSQSSNIDHISDDSSNMNTIKVSFHETHKVYPVSPVNSINSPVLTQHDPPDFPTPILSSEFETTTTVSNDTVLHTGLNEDENDAGLAGAFAQLTLGAPRTAEQSALEDHLRRQGWEVGNIDYLGRDSFENIWSKICSTIGVGETPPVQEAAKTPVPAPAEGKSEPPAAVRSEPPPVTKPKAPTSSPTSEVQTPQQLPTEEVVTEQKAPSSAEIPQEPIELSAGQTETKLIEQTAATVPTTQILPPTPTTPIEPEVCPLKASLPEAAECPLAPKALEPETPLPVPECPIPSKKDESQTPLEPAVCPLPAEPQIPVEPAVCSLPSKPAQPEIPQPLEPAVCSLPEPSSNIPLDIITPQTPTQMTECSLPAKPSEPDATKSNIPLPVKVEPQSPSESKALESPLPATLPEASTLTECPLIPKTPEPSGQKDLPSQSPVETPIVPETPPVVAAPPPKAPEPSSPKPELEEPKPKPEEPKPKPEEPKSKPEEPKSKVEEPSTTSESAVSTPTPPPRKGSGGTKKTPKPKK